MLSVEEKKKKKKEPVCGKKGLNTYLYAIPIETSYIDV